MRKYKILIIDDDSDILDVLNLSLSEHFTIFPAHNGQEGLALVRSKIPDLVITDYMMPVLNGPQFIKELRKDVLLRHLPVIMLTGKGETKDMVTGIEAGADDYIVKPFEPEALLARIRMILNRTMRSLDANPLTRLPGNTSIMEEIQNYIDSGMLFAVGYADLDKFKIYNDKYGFEKGDELIRATARILVDAVQKVTEDKGFVGHIGGDDFVFLCEDRFADQISERVISGFDQEILSFYNDEDRNAGFVTGKDRQGNATTAGLVSISIGIVSNRDSKITHVAQIGEFGAELKKFAKSVAKSNFVRNQRKA